MAKDLVRNDILVRLRRAICCISARGEEITNKYANGLEVGGCEIKDFQYLTAVVEALTCYEPPITEVLSTGSFDVTGTNGTIWVTVNGFPVTTAAVNFTTDLNTTASAIEAAVDADSTVPDYTARVSSATITLTGAEGSGEKPNGWIISAITTGDMAIANVSNMSGGVIGITDADNCFTLLKAENMFSYLEEKAGIKFAPAGATYVDPTLIYQQTESIVTQTGQTIDLSTPGGSEDILITENIINIKG